MNKLFFFFLAMGCRQALSQNNMTSNIIEGSKTLVDLIRVIKTPRTSIPSATTLLTDSCATKNLADVSYKNNTGKAMVVSLYKRTGALYAAVPLSLKILPNTTESLYEIMAGIYKYRIEFETEGIRSLQVEREIKIQSCDKLFKEIKKE
jgi:hypothetical protein